MNQDFEIGLSGSSRSRILICDDSADGREAIARFLRDAGYHVDEVGDGAAALDHLRNREVDALLLDLQMPGVDGFHVLKHLQKNRRGLPVILLSGMPLDQIQGHIHSLPSHSLPPLFIKPVDLPSLIDVLELQLSGALDDLDDGVKGAEGLG
jgi:CheY-like chemotaxis protein